MRRYVLTLTETIWMAPASVDKYEEEPQFGSVCTCQFGLTFTENIYE